MSDPTVPTMREWMRIVEATGSASAIARAFQADPSRHPGVEVRLIPSGSTLTIDHIESSEKQQGHASWALQRLCQMADQQGVTLILQPVSYADHGQAPGGLEMDGLVMWYEGFGFELDNDTGMMTRLPGAAMKTMKIVENTQHSRSPTSTD